MHDAYDAVVERLRTRLQQPLPGSTAHALMAPQPRRAWPAGFNPARIRHAAGLLLVFPIDGRAHVLLTVRSETLGRHGGQVSLPGGVAEPGETYEQAALREAHEEVGLDPNSVRVIGALTPIDIPISGFRLHPIVAAADHRPSLAPADQEVARILEAGVLALCDPATRIEIARDRGSGLTSVPAFCMDDAEIWGATAMVLAEFLTLLGWTLEAGGAGKAG
jgi:8-oxo-dGTP pyrophosphatase MutT (NUDIX family)